LEPHYEKGPRVAKQLLNKTDSNDKRGSQQGLLGTD